MSLRSSFERLRAEPPRLLSLIQADTKDEVPLGHRRVPRAEAIRRFAPLMEHVASGTVPIDEASAPMVAQVMEHVWREGTRPPREKGAPNV